MLQESCVTLNFTGVVALAEAAEQTGGRGGVDDATILLLAEVRPCGF